MAGGDERRGSRLTLRLPGPLPQPLWEVHKPLLLFLSVLKSAPPHPPHTHLLLSHVVFVVAAPSFNEVRLLVYHRVTGWASAGGAVYLLLKVRAAQP